jgi:hypothetical protein
MAQIDHSKPVEFLLDSKIDEQSKVRLDLYQAFEQLFYQLGISAEMGVEHEIEWIKVHLDFAKQTLLNRYRELHGKRKA